MKDFWPNQFILLLQEPEWFHLKIHRDSYCGPFRSVKEWQELDPESKNDQDHVKKQEINRLPGNDPHIWLDPLNAQKITQYLVQILSKFDPENAQTYNSNGKKTILRLSNLNIQLETKMSSVSSKPYIVFHDAYQYFEKRYQLNPIASVTASSGTFNKCWEVDRYP